MQIASWKLRKTWVNLFFLYTAALTLANGLIVVRVNRGWALANWLVNYEGGFIRRGLPGQIAFFLGRLTHLSPVVYVVLCYLALYAVIFWVGRFFALASSLNLWILALVLSPATFSFQVLHPRSGFNKEIIHIAALALFLLLLKKGKLTSTGVIIYLTIVTTLGTLSHEGNIFYAPYFFAALMFTGRSFLEAAKECALPAVAGAITAYFCAQHPGSEPIAAQICSSLGYKFEVPNSNEICASGAMVYLIRTREFARAETVKFIHEYQYLIVFPCFAALALLPAVAESFVLRRARFSRDLVVLWLSVTASFLGTLVLFYYAVDWGRWIYIHVISIAFLLLYLDVLRTERDGPDTVARAEIPLGRRVAGWAFLFAYAALWILPTAAEPLRLGYVGRLKYLSHFSNHASTEVRGTAD